MPSTSIKWPHFGNGDIRITNLRDVDDGFVRCPWLDPFSPLGDSSSEPRMAQIPYSHTLQDLRRPVQSSLTGNEPLYLWLAVELENRSNQNFRLISASLFEVFGTCRPIPVCVSGWSIYTMSWKRCHYRPILPLTLPNADRFSKFFHRQTAVNF